MSDPNLSHLWAQLPPSKPSKRRRERRRGPRIVVESNPARIQPPRALTHAERFEKALRSSSPLVGDRELMLLGLERMGL